MRLLFLHRPLFLRSVQKASDTDVLMKAALLFICLYLPCFALLADTRAAAMGEALSADCHYMPLDSLQTCQSWQWQTQLPYLQGELWQNALSYRRQNKSNSQEWKCSHLGRDILCLGVRHEHLFKKHWQAGIGLYYAYWRPPKTSVVGMDCHLLYLPNEAWQIHVLTQQCLLTRHTQAYWQSYFCVSGAYSTEAFCLIAELAYPGRSTLTSHYGMELYYEHCTIRWGCSFPQTRPSLGISWRIKQTELASALVYDWSLGISAQLSICYRYRHE